jgi:hypothetical protein
VQGRNSYAIKIRTQQQEQEQEQFAFSECEVQSEFARNAQRINAGFKLAPVKVCPQQIRQRNQQVQSDIRTVEPLDKIRKEQPQHGFEENNTERLGSEQPSANWS